MNPKRGEAEVILTNDEGKREAHVIHLYNGTVAQLDDLTGVPLLQAMRSRRILSISYQADMITLGLRWKDKKSNRAKVLDGMREDPMHYINQCMQAVLRYMGKQEEADAIKDPTILRFHGKDEEADAVEAEAEAEAAEMEAREGNRPEA